MTTGRVLVDSGSLEEIEEVVVRDRKHLSEEGVVIPIIAIDKHTGRTVWARHLARLSASTPAVAGGTVYATVMERLHGGGGSFDQLHAVDYLVYAYLQEARDTSARNALA